MIDPKKLLSDFLGSNVPGMNGTVKDKAGQAIQKAKDNPLAAGAILAAMLGTGVGRELTGSALKLGGAAAVWAVAARDAAPRCDHSPRSARCNSVRTCAANIRPVRPVLFDAAVTNVWSCVFVIVKERMRV